MSEFWLPADSLTPATVKGVRPGQILIEPPSRKGPIEPAIGIRFNIPNRLMVFALTPFRGGIYPAGDAIDLSMYKEPVLTIDAALSIEADLASEATSAFDRDFAAGELVLAQEGMGISAHFGRHNPELYESNGTIDISTWEGRERETVRMIFGGWRLRIDIADRKPVYWTPSFAPKS